MTTYEPFEFLHLPLVQDKVNITINVVDQCTIGNDETYEFTVQSTPEVFEAEKDDVISKLVDKLNEKRHTPNTKYLFLERKEDKKHFIRVCIAIVMMIWLVLQSQYSIQEQLLLQYERSW